MSFRNDGEIALLASHPLLSQPKHFFVSATFEFTGDAPLSWYLSPAAVNRLVLGPGDRDVKTGRNLVGSTGRASVPRGQTTPVIVGREVILAVLQGNLSGD